MRTTDPLALPERTLWRSEALRRLGAPTLIATVFVMLALAGSVLALRQTYLIENQARARAERSTDVLGALYAVMATSADAQTGQRGFVLTREGSFYVHFEEAIDRLPLDLDRLDAVSTAPSDPSQEAAIAHLRALAEEHAAYLAETISFAAAADPGIVVERVREARAERLLEDMRAVARTIDAAEDSLRLEAFADARAVERLAFGLQTVLALSVLAAFVLGVHYIQRTLRAETAAKEAAALRAANVRTDLLAKELDHRVKNVFALVAAVVSASARGETDVRQMADKVSGRIQALSRAHAVSRGSTACPTPTLRDLLAVLLEPYETGPGRLEMRGEEVDLPSSMATPLGLIIHELATNAVQI
ncbi:CHASE3 domain-containing protein, partial [Parvularcula oceani]|uniref:CHASE3 domain-containing protein n=1 Tax=Parvularcula oceani TaxID=1247963 RepID=UPI00192E47FE